MSIRQIALCLCIVGLVGCSKSPAEKAADHRAKAATYLKEGKVEEAVLELRSALQAVPKDKEALYQLGEAFTKNGQFGEAFQSYRKVTELDPKDFAAQVKLGTFYLLGGKLEEAKKCADIVAGGAPNLADGHVLRAKIDLREGKIDESFQELDRAVELDPGNLETRLVRAAAFLGVHKLDEARKAVEEVLTKDATYAKALLLLAQIAELQKDPKTADNAFATLLKAKPEDPGVWMNYGNLLLSRGNEKEGLSAFKKAGEVDKKGTAGWEKLAEIYLAKGDLPAAKEAVGEIRSRAAKSVAATFFDGRVALAERRLDEASAKFAEVAKQYPNRPDVHYFLALALFGQHNTRQAKAECQKAVDLQPGYLKARMLLTQIHLDLREFDLALKESDEFFKMPRIPAEAVFLRSGALLGVGKVAEARSLVEKLVAQAPGNVKALERLGTLYLAEKKPQKALEAFEKASAADPKDLLAVEMTARVLVSQKKLDEAFARVNAHIKRSGESARAHELLAQLYLVKRDPEAAKREFQAAIDVDPNAVESYLALASFHRGPDALRKALADTDKALAQKQKYLQAWMLKGALHDQGGQFEEANKAYRKALEIKPDLVPALNNLAWNLAEHGGNIDEALKFAERAVELAPKAATVSDTLGWVYVKQGTYGKALEQLEPAAESLPKNSAVLYHLAAAYAGKGDPKKAVAVLERAFEANKEFPGSGEARMLLAESREAAKKQ